MRATVKVAIAEALRSDDNVTKLVPPASRFTRSSAPRCRRAASGRGDRAVERARR